MASSLAEAPIKAWTSVNYITCNLCLTCSSEHLDEMLDRLHKSTGVPEKKFIYKQLITIVDEKFNDDKDIKKRIHSQLRTLINERLFETAQHVCLCRKNKLSLQSIANELSHLPQLLSVDEARVSVSFRDLERFIDIYGRVELDEHGRQAIQSSERHSPALVRGRNIYDRSQTSSTFEIRLQIEQFHSNIYIGICSHDASPGDIDDRSNTFPISPTPSSRQGDIFHLLIDVNEHEIYLWNEYRPRKYHNTEQKKRRRTISKWKCALPWRFLVILTSKDNHIRIVY